MKSKATVGIAALAVSLGAALGVSDKISAHYPSFPSGCHNHVGAQYCFQSWYWQNNGIRCDNWIIYYSGGSSTHVNCYLVAE